MRLKTFPALIFLLISSQLHASEPSLYQRIGGDAVLSKVVEESVGRIANDPRFNHSFEKVNLTKLYPKITFHLCSITGGNCSYTGDDIKAIHAGLDITEAEFYALVESLRQALDDNQVCTPEKNELLKLLAPMKRDVVTK